MSYAILEENDNLNKLCFRSGYRLEKINFSKRLSGKEIIEKLKIELDVEEQDLHINLPSNKKYKLYKLSVSQMGRVRSWIGGLFRKTIGGILLVYSN